MRTKFQAAVASVLIVTVTPVLGVSTIGCSTWISNFKKDPVGQIQNIIQIVQTIVAAGTVIFGQVKPTLPADEQTKAQAEWDAAILKTNGSIGALQAAVKVAVDANHPNPDLTKLVSDLVASINALHSVINLYAGHPGAPGRLGGKPPPKGYDLFVQQIALLKGHAGSVSASAK